jgi:UDP-2-acetamido-2-deoxy-ribo-hexuluronate aminotransferase
MQRHVRMLWRYLRSDALPSPVLPGVELGSNWMIPFIDLHPVSRLVADAVAARWAGVVERCEFVGGAGVQELEAEIARFCATRTAIACSNGSDALVLALQAAGVQAGMHVALPNLTFWATFEAVVQLGAIPVLIDISPDDLQLDLDELRRAHARYRFRHAILVHLYGWASAALLAIRAFCADHDVCLIEDAAQAIGVELAGQPVLAGAAIATLSFYPAKVIGGCMDGGAVVTGDGDLARTVRSLANHGRSAHYSYQRVGWNSRMGGLQAHYLLEMMKHAGAILAARRRLVAAYRAQWTDIAGRLRGPSSEIAENGYLLVVECERPADGCVAAFEQRAIGVARTYPETIDQQAPARGRFVAAGELGRSRAFAQRVLNLPLYFGLSEHAVAEVAGAARHILRCPR